MDWKTYDVDELSHLWLETSRRVSRATGAANGSLQISDLPDFSSLGFEDADVAMRLIEHVVNEASLAGSEINDADLDFLGAGLLEDTVNYHGQEVLPRIEALSMLQPTFKRILKIVNRWPDQMSNELWERILAARS